MNERIRELAEQCNLYDGWFCGKGNIENFAELIVRECVNKIEIYQIPVGNSAAGEMACEWTKELYYGIYESRT